MNNIKFVIKKITIVDYKGMWKGAKSLAKKRKKIALFLFIDMIWCGLKYGAGYNDYIEFDFDILNAKQRKTYLTSNINDKALKKYNNKEYVHFFSDKVEFFEKFKEFMKRDYLYLKDAKYEDFEKFVKGKEKICVKPINLSSGHGIEIIKLKEEKDLKKLYNRLIKNDQLLCEDFIYQHEEMMNIWPKAVNSIRVISFLTDDNEVAFLGIAMKIGMKEGIDNHSNGGLCTFVNDEGIITEPAYDDDNHVYYNHPITNAKIVGFKLPYYNEIKELITKAAKVIPEVRYVGWDVAITKDGPIIIEGNEYCGVFQMSGMASKTKTGILPTYRKYMDI